MATGSFQPHSCNTEIALFKVNASTAIAEGDAVTYAVSTGLITAAADSCTTGIIGIAAASGAVSTFIPVYLNGIFRGTASANLAPGAVAYIAGSAGAQTLDAGSMSDVSVGVVVNTDPAATGDIFFRLQRSRVTANTIDTPVTHA